MENIIDNIENGKFSDAKEELTGMVKDNITSRIADAQSEMGLKATIEEEPDTSIDANDVDDADVDDNTEE